MYNTGANQACRGKHGVAAAGRINSGMVNAIYFRSDFAPEKAFFGPKRRKIRKNAVRRNPLNMF
jgi:hypothetical protein